MQKSLLEGLISGVLTAKTGNISVSIRRNSSLKRSVTYIIHVYKDTTVQTVFSKAALRCWLDWLAVMSIDDV